MVKAAVQKTMDILCSDKGLDKSVYENINDIPSSSSSSSSVSKRSRECLDSGNETAPAKKRTRVSDNNGEQYVSTQASAADSTGPTVNGSEVSGELDMSSAKRCKDVVVTKMSWTVKTNDKTNDILDFDDTEEEEESVGIELAARKYSDRGVLRVRKPIYVNAVNGEEVVGGEDLMVDLHNGRLLSACPPQLGFTSAVFELCEFPPDEAPEMEMTCTTTETTDVMGVIFREQHRLAEGSVKKGRRGNGIVLHESCQNQCDVIMGSCQAMWNKLPASLTMVSAHTPFEWSEPAVPGAFNVCIVGTTMPVAGNVDDCVADCRCNDDCDSCFCHMIGELDPLEIKTVRCIYKVKLVQ